MATKSPIGCKEIRVEGFDEKEWSKVVDDFLWFGLLAKFMQNDGARKYLLKTEGKDLVYCDPQDPVLGIGLDRFCDESDIPEKWAGQNRMGIMLEKVRENIVGRPDMQEEVKQARKEKIDLYK